MVSPMPSMQSSVRAGEGAAEVTERAATAREQSPSLGAQGRQRTEHESQDTAKKTLLAKKVTRSKDGSQPSLGKESDGDQQLRSRLHRSRQAEADSMPSGTAGRRAGWTKSRRLANSAAIGECGWSETHGAISVTKENCPKVARQIQAQQRIQQQALQLSPVCIFLPSALAGTPKSFKTTKKSLAVGTDEQEHLNQEMRAGQVLFTEYGLLGMSWAVLMQPAQPTGTTVPSCSCHG